MVASQIRGTRLADSRSGSAAAAARQTGLIRHALAVAGTPIGPHATLIAGHALSRDLVLVTHATREFRRVPGLVVKD